MNCNNFEKMKMKKPQPGGHVLPSSFKNIESFKHALAKELSADFILNQVAQPKTLRTTIYKLAA